MTTVAPARQRLKVVCPHDCPDTCVMTVDVEGGRAVGLGGDPDHRFTQGFLCAKVNHYLERVYSPDRRHGGERSFQPHSTLPPRLRDGRWRDS